MSNIAIFGGSFNPPGLHHREIALVLSNDPFFDEIIVFPCGHRPDKCSTNFMSADHRAALCGITFSGISRTTVDLFDLEMEVFTRTYNLMEVFTRTHDLQAKFSSKGNIWHVVGADLVAGGQQSEIVTKWQYGSNLWTDLNFLIVPRIGFELTDDDFPPHYRKLNFPTRNREASSSTIRELIYRGESFEHLVMPKAAAYIKHYGLYRKNMAPSKPCPVIAGDDDFVSLGEASNLLSILRREDDSEVFPIVSSTIGKPTVEVLPNMELRINHSPLHVKKKGKR